MRKKVENAIRIINDSTISKHGIKESCIQIAYYHDKEEDQDMTLFYGEMRDSPRWHIAVVCYDSEVYAPLEKLHLRLLLISLLAFGVLLFIVGCFAKNEEKLKQIAGGRFNFSVEYDMARNAANIKCPGCGAEGTLRS